MNLISSRILCIFAHPDDESYIVGGTIARATAQGAEVTVISVTKGDKGFQHIKDPSEKDRLIHIREEEMKNAARVLGVKEVILWDYPDGELDTLVNSGQEIVDRLIKEIERIAPNLILTFGPDGVSGHRDHIAISNIVHKLLTIQPFNNQVPAYGVTISREFNHAMEQVIASRRRTTGHYDDNRATASPALSEVERVDISNFTEKKFAAMRAHVSQNPDGLIAAYTSQPKEFWNYEYFLPLTDTLS